LRGRLSEVPGVARAEVSFEEKTAHVFFGEGQPRPSDERLLGAIREAGYSGALLEGYGRGPERGAGDDRTRGPRPARP
jgi:copper chaperone CopZ